MTPWFAGVLGAWLVLMLSPGAGRHSWLRRLHRAPAPQPPADPVIRAPSTGPPETDLVAVLGQLAGLARAGLSPSAALVLVAGTCGRDEVGGALRAAAGVVARGEPALACLRRCPALAGLAATWSVVTVTGAPVADAIERLAAATAEELDAVRAIEAVLAGPRATARLLLALPPIAVLLAEAMGVGALGTLTGTGVGRACLLIGLAGLAGGWWWSRHLIRAAT